MFKVFANMDFLEGVLLDKTPKNWYNIFMSGNVAEVCVPEEIDDEEKDKTYSSDEAKEFVERCAPDSLAVGVARA